MIRLISKKAFPAAGALLLALSLPLGLSAQTDSPKPPPPAPPAASHSGWQFKTYYLTSVVGANDASEVMTALRNMVDPNVRIYLVPSQNAIAVYAPADQHAIAQRLISDLDRPKKAYRVTYTLTELDNGKRIGTSHFTVVVVSGQRTVTKQGSKVPIVTGTVKGAANEEQYTYLDVGLNIDSSVDSYGTGVRLRSKVEQSAIAEEKSVYAMRDPVVRQTVLEGTSFLSDGKPVVLGSMDVPGTSRRYDITVAFEPAT